MQAQNLSDLYRSDPIKACRLALRRTRKVDSEERIKAIDELLNGHGEEALRGSWSNGYWGEVVAGYVNMGDTYSVTVFQVRTGPEKWNCRFEVNNFGNFFEKNEKRMELY